MLRKTTAADMESRPVIADTQLLSCQVVYNVMWLSAYYSNSLLAVWIACRMVQISMRHGVSVVSSVGFATLGTAIMRYVPVNGDLAR